VLKRVITKHPGQLNALDEVLIVNFDQVDLIFLGKNGDTPISLASKEGHLEAVQYLLSCKASTELIRAVIFLMQDRIGSNFVQDQWSALHYASNNNHVEVVKELLKNGAVADLANTVNHLTRFLNSCA
jgi:ankyrin repeat protein